MGEKFEIVKSLFKVFCFFECFGFRLLFDCSLGKDRLVGELGFWDLVFWGEF